MNGPLFDRYIMADYSGAADPAAQRKAIAVAIIVRGGQNDAEDPTRYFERKAQCHIQCFTREVLRKAILRLLREKRSQHNRLLFGIDHQFSWPVELLELCGLSDVTWREALKSLLRGNYGGPALDHPKTFCAKFNEFCRQNNHTPAFFSPTGLYGLPKLSQDARPHFRLVEEEVRKYGFNPKCANEIGTNGAVGGQTITGMLELARIVEAAEKESLEVAFWPFDGLDLNGKAYRGKHVGVEIYPTCLRRSHVPQNDRNDAMESLRAAWLADSDGNLVGLTGVDRIDESQYTRVENEGWMLGVSERCRNRTCSECGQTVSDAHHKFCFNCGQSLVDHRQPEVGDGAGEPEWFRVRNNKSGSSLTRANEDRRRIYLEDRLIVKGEKRHRTVTRIMGRCVCTKGQGEWPRGEIVEYRWLGADENDIEPKKKVLMQ